MPSNSPSPPPLTVPQNTPYTSQPATSHGTPTSTRSPDSLSHPLYTLPSLVNTLLPKTQLARPPPRQQNPSLTAAISGLQLHPTLEASLHILNADLPSAHFLVRHMSAPPAIEGMLLHSILHRVEGDYANARAWLADVRDAVEGWIPKHRSDSALEKDVMQAMKLKGVASNLVQFVYEEEGEDAGQLIDDVEKFRSARTEADECDVEERVRRELERVVEWCRKKFGEGPWMDASEAWVRPGEEIKKIGNDMVIGDKGWRKF